MKQVQVQVKNSKGVIEIVEVKEVPLCFCGKEMYIYEHVDYEHVDGLREWRCVDNCMMELITRCTRCEDWVYEDLCSPEDFDDTLGITFYIGHPHCMEEKARELQNARGGTSHES